MSTDEKVKIVYNWIGPRGPIWNTEVPHVLNFAAVMEGAQPNSHNFWTDDIWLKLFSNTTPHWTINPTFWVEQQDYFIYPFSLTWRIPFHSYFLGNTGILEFSHTPGHITYNVRNHRGFFLIDMSVEAFMQDDHLTYLHNYWNITNGIPLNKIIYITGCMNAARLYEDFCTRRGIPNRPDQRLSIIAYPSSQNIFAIQLNEESVKEPAYDPSFVPEKLFLVWNRRFRWHRTQLALALEKNKLLDRSYVSMGVNDPEMPSHFFKDTINVDFIPSLEITQEDANSLVSKLPLVIDGETNNNKMCQDIEGKTRDFYSNSLVSIVTETNYDLPELTLTEKSFKPCREKHPFIIVGVAGSLKAMRELGFQTFSEFWSEEYDEVDCPLIRMRKIVEVCKEIGSWDNEKILDFKRRVHPILNNNFNLLKTKPAIAISEKIYQIVRNNAK